MKTVLSVVSMFLFGAAAMSAFGAQQKIEPQTNRVPAGVQVAGVAGKGKPDITNEKGGIIIGGAVGGAGGKFVAWGGFADLSDIEPLPGTSVNGQCAFNVAYQEINIGGAPTSPDYINRLRVDTGVVSINSARHLNAGEAKQVDTQAYFKEGSHGFFLSLDDDNVVAESNEGNNHFGFKYTLKCGGQGKKELPDITDEKRGIIIGGAVGGAGGKFVPWGGFADLSAVTPLPGTVVNGKCAFNVAYNEINIGTAPTTPDFINKLYVDATDVAINSGQHLNAGEGKPVDTQAYLTEGSHALTLKLDDGNLVTESNESNNQFSIKYTLKCNGQGNPTGQQLPDLIAILPSPMNGHVSVKNIGAGPAGPSKLTLDCHKEGHTGPGGGCVDPPAALAAAYHDPAFPDKVTIDVPALAPGATFNHTLSFWPALKWPSGKYDFTAFADAANTVVESNESNNTATTTLTVP